MTRALLAITLSLALFGCGDSPTSPSPTPTPPPIGGVPAPPPTAQIAGRWSGRMDLSFRGQRIFVETQSSFRTDVRTVDGTWFVTTRGNDISGTIIGSVSGGMFSGTVTWSSDTEPPTGARCRGTAQFSGATSATELRWTSMGWDFGSTCSDPPRDVVWTSQPMPRVAQ